MGMFELDSRLESGLLFVCDFELCQVRMMPDPECPWLVLVPKRAGMREIHELSESDQGLLLAEITRCTKLLEEKFTPEKINLGALGNIVPQLHIHLIARYLTDRAWPDPIWGVAMQNDPEKVEQNLAIVQAALKK